MHQRLRCPQACRPEAGVRAQMEEQLLCLGPEPGRLKSPWSYKSEGSNTPPKRHYIRVAAGFHGGLESCVEMLT